MTIVCSIFILYRKQFICKPRVSVLVLGALLAGLVCVYACAQCANLLANILLHLTSYVLRCNGNGDGASEATLVCPFASSSSFGRSCVFVSFGLRSIPIRRVRRASSRSSSRRSSSGGEMIFMLGHSIIAFARLFCAYHCRSVTHFRTTGAPLIKLQ